MKAGGMDIDFGMDSELFKMQVVQLHLTYAACRTAKFDDHLETKYNKKRNNAISK